MTRRSIIPLPLIAAQRAPTARDLYYEPPENQRLGLRYTLFREMRGKWVEVPRGATLRTGDRVRMLFESNTAGVLFLVARVPGGSWEPAAPGLPVRIAPERSYTLPPKGEWILDPPAGEEILYLVFGREGDESLANLIEDSRSGATEKLFTAVNVRTRDLVLDLESESQPEAAHYAVNSSVKSDAKIALEVRIRHREPR